MVCHANVGWDGPVHLQARCSGGEAGPWCQAGCFSRGLYPCLNYKLVDSRTSGLLQAYGQQHVGGNLATWLAGCVEWQDPIQVW